MLSATSSLRMLKDKNLDGSMIEMAYGAPLVTDPPSSSSSNERAPMRPRRSGHWRAFVSLSTSVRTLAFELKLEMVGTRSMVWAPPPPPNAHTHLFPIDLN